ncbi:hypothetical protein C8Q77DRAFT_1244640, partial [Trametes polyzona]
GRHAARRFYQCRFCHPDTRSVRDLLARLSDEMAPETELQPMAAALLLRVHDSDASVLQALYTTSPEVNVRAFLAASPSPAGYLDALKHALHGSNAKPSRDVIRAHLTFLFTHFLPAVAVREEDDAEATREFMRQAALDIPRQKTAQAMWDILKKAEDAGTDPALFELLGGYVDAVRGEQQKQSAAAKDKDGEKESLNVGLLTRINLAVAAKIAGTSDSSPFRYYVAKAAFQITSSRRTTSTGPWDRLLEKLHDENHHARALVYLVTCALLGRVGGEQRVETARRVLQVMRLDTLKGMGDFMRGVDDIAAFLNDASVGSAVVLKPSSVNTLDRLQVALLSVFPNIPRPAGARLDWLADHSQNATASSRHAAHYDQLLRDVYRLSNSSAHLALLSTHLLCMLFGNLGDDALAFLAGVWLNAGSISESDSTDEHTQVQYAALRHAAAFLDAHLVADRTANFQTVFPAMLVMLQSPDESVRGAVARCIAVVVRICGAKEAESVYAFDAIYGAQSDKLQYLDWADFTKYAQVVGEARANLERDPNYLQAFHQKMLTQSKADHKKTSGYKQRVLCHLLSHVNSCPLPGVKASLLRNLDNVTNEVKAQVLMPTIESLVSEQGIRDVANNRAYQELAAYAASAFDATAAPDLNDPAKDTYAVYEKVLLTSLRDGTYILGISFAEPFANSTFFEARWQRARDALLHRLQHGLFAKLCQSLLQVAVEDESLGLVCKKVHGNVLSDVSLIIRLLVASQLSAEDASQPASKCPRVEQSVTEIRATEISTLAVLAEVLGSTKIAGPLELVSCLLETLSKVTHTVAPDAANRRFVEQLIMSAVENVVHNFPAATVVPPGSIRVDTVVEILRTSENPQSFHQASLLMASLARIAPDAVLHNVMPILTFMGSNIFHRDDTTRTASAWYKSIVPVMVASLKEKHGTGMDLYRAAREFLRVFTSAANHVPRHRRVNSFSHLVDTLGPADFLAPVTMLLVDRVANRAVRQNSAESAGSLFLPSTACERYPARLQLSLFVELVHEVERLSQPDNLANPPFLEDAPEDEHPHAETSSKRRAAAFLLLCDHALRHLKTTALATSEEERTLSKTLLGLLLAVSTVHVDDPSPLRLT